MRKSRRSKLASAIVVIEDLSKYLNAPEADDNLRQDLLGLLIRYIKTLHGNVHVVIPVPKIIVNTISNIVLIILKRDMKVELPVQGLDDVKTESLARYLGIRAYKDVIIVNI